MSRPEAPGSTPPLVVDVDTALLRTDLVDEALLQFIAGRPAQAWRLAPWLLRGPAGFRAALSAHAQPDGLALPLRPAALDLIEAARGEGRAVHLVSAFDARVVDALAARLGGVDSIVAADDLREFTSRLGPGGFDYVTGGAIDTELAGAARLVHMIGRSRRAGPNARVVREPGRSPNAYLRALRPHQWAKNLLVFLPLVAGHQFDRTSLFAALLAFVCFSLAASSAYILNDLLDLAADRAHPRKRWRPFAAGEAPIAHGVLMSVALMAAAIGLSTLNPPGFNLVLLLYVAVTLSYSLVLKRRMLIDVITLGGLYTLRVFAGVVAVDALASPWLLTFCLFIFLSLATVKRVSELAMPRVGEASVAGRGYAAGDLPVMTSLAGAAGFVAILVVTLYFASPEVLILYRHPFRLWLIVPLLLYWISRIVLIANRGELHDDPLVFALTDRVSWVVGFGAALVIASAL